MALFRHFTGLAKRVTQENVSFCDTYSQVFSSPLVKPNLPSLLCVCKKRTTAAEELGIPEPPKKVIPAFLKFAHDRMPTLSNSLLTRKDQFVEIKTDWLKLEEWQRSKYHDDYKIGYEDYRKRFKAYLDNLSDDQKLQLQSLRSHKLKEKKERRLHRQHLKAQEESGRPKHPGTVFALFCRKDGGKGNFRELHQKWNLLSEEQKAVYVEGRRAIYEEYKIKMASWEKMMEETGRSHLIMKKPGDN